MALVQADATEAVTTTVAPRSSSARYLTGRGTAWFPVGLTSLLLAAATKQTQAMIGDVRRLIYGLRPPALDELGLVDSVRSLAAREVGSAARVTVEARPSLPPLHAAVEVAAYHIVQETLTNVSRHAHAQFRRVRLSGERDALLLEIADDGLGIAEHHAGIGLHMQERAAELGGSCQITSIRGSGTTVSARLPRHAPSEEAD